MAFVSFMITIFCMLCMITTLPKTASSQIPNKNNFQTYIVHLDPHLTPQSEDLESWHRSFLPATTASSGEEEARIIYSYRHVFKGFAARLSPDQVKEMEKKEGFISARPQKPLSLHTTHSPNFLGLNRNMGFWKDSNYGKGVIIGVLDSGVLPEHPSFHDEGMPPPPAKWKGKCEFNHTTCNKKIIGARYFRSEDQSPLDDNGHGTHTASTAAGSFVQGANVLGSANGTAAGVAPLAHLAIYKVCCGEDDALAGMDAAVEDGVDVLSISLGPDFVLHNFFEDSIVVGAFSAMEKGIFVSCSASNEGPDLFTVQNGAPWILTVGASTIDRKLRAKAVLGNNQEFAGESAFQPKNFRPKLLPLVYAGMLNASDEFAPYCFNESLSQADIRGKIVVCETGGATGVAKGEAVKRGGGAAMILINRESSANITDAEAHVLPATSVGYADGLKIKAYINSTAKPTATISFEGTVIGDDHAPIVASFSSRGPNYPSPGILKPDILGPGVNIVAAWPTSVGNINTNTKSTFNTISGTSMSCPHLSGVAALLKSAHPHWSPAAIKSAIMTTADVLNLAHRPIEDERFLPANIFATGAGHVNPSRANDPGLIYDIQPKDYVPYLCGLNYTDRQVGSFVQRRVKCAVESSIPEAQLNYPSFSLVFTNQSKSQLYTRTVTNVGNPVSSYDVVISPPGGVDVRVEPMKLKFSKLNQKLQYKVTFKRLASAPNNTVVQGFLKWTSTKHSVRSPIAVVLV